MFLNDKEKVMFERYSYTKGLTNLIKSDKEYLINVLGQIKDKNGNDVKISKDNNGDIIVKVKSWNGFTFYRVIDLMALHFKFLTIPEEFYHHVKAFVIDGDKENLHATNIGYRFKDGKLEVPNYPNFYYIPMFTDRAINIDGELLNVKTGEKINWYITKPSKNKNDGGGYRASTLNGRHLSRHRAIGHVFLDYPDNSDDLVINHKDGKGGYERNDSPENLEWVTYSENNKHAYKNDLKNQNKRVLARNVFTGEVTEYYSIADCARDLGYSGDGTIWFRLYNAPFSIVFPDGYQFKLKDDTRDWIIPYNPKEAIKKVKQSVAIKVRNCLTKEITSYKSMAEAAKATGTKHGTIHYRFSINDERPLNGYQFKLLDDESNWYNFTDEEYKKSLVPNSFKLDCYNHFTKETLTFDSLRDAVKHFNTKAFVETLRNGDQPLFSNGWQFKYSNDQWKVFDDIEEEIYKRTKEIMGRDIKADHVYISPSAQALQTYLKSIGKNFDVKVIRKAALTRGNQVYNGFQFRLGHTDEKWPTV